MNLTARIELAIDESSSMPSSPHEIREMIGDAIGDMLTELLVEDRLAVRHWSVEVKTEPPTVFRGSLR